MRRELYYCLKYYYLINNVYNSISKDSNRKRILSITRLSVCPYCNRNFMNSSNNKNTCELRNKLNQMLLDRISPNEKVKLLISDLTDEELDLLKKRLKE